MRALQSYKHNDRDRCNHSALRVAITEYSLPMRERATASYTCRTMCGLLGGSPYSTDNIDEHFVDKLKRGYRLDKPTFAIDEVYVSYPYVLKSCFFLASFITLLVVKTT